MRRLRTLPARVAAAAAVVTLAVAAVAAALQLRGGGDDARLRAFLTLPTRSSCDASSPPITVETSRFAAFVPDQPGLRSEQGKFLIVAYTVSGAAAAAISDHFILAAPSGDRYRPRAASPGPTPADPATAELLFDVPLDLAAAKLVFDDGCTHAEWITP
jgi:hypothetical protein